MVHIGNNPPNLDEIAELPELRRHHHHCYNGKPNRIPDAEGELRRLMTSRDLKRGVRLDVGHGTAELELCGGKTRDRTGHSAAHHQLRYLLSQPYQRPGNSAGKRDVEIPRHRYVIAAGRLNASPPTPPMALRLQRSKGAALGVWMPTRRCSILSASQPVLTDAENDSLQAEHILLPLAAIARAGPYDRTRGTEMPSILRIRFKTGY